MFIAYHKSYLDIQFNENVRWLKNTFAHFFSATLAKLTIEWTKPTEDWIIYLLPAGIVKLVQNNIQRFVVPNEYWYR